MIGSQAILGQFPEGAPARAVVSMEADLLPIDAPEMSDMLTGAIGELSSFHDTFGYFGDGVSIEAAVLPDGWRERLIIGLCLEVHELVISKYAAGRDKDREFCAALVESGLVDQGILQNRLASTPLDTDNRVRIERWIATDYAAAGFRA